MKKFLSILLTVCVILASLMFSACGESESGKLRALKINNAEIACHVDMDKVLSAFSDLKYEYSESISCAYNGMDKIYDFAEAGFIIYTYPVEDKDFVLEVAVSSENITQRDGKVKVGMTKDEVIALFGSDYTTEGDTITYNVKDEQNMYFLLDGDSVIEYAISVAE